MFSAPHQSKNDSGSVRSLKLTHGTKKLDIISIIKKFFKDFKFAIIKSGIVVRICRPQLS